MRGIFLLYNPLRGSVIPLLYFFLIAPSLSLHAGISAKAFDISKGLSRFDVILRPVKQSYPTPYYIGGILTEERSARYIERRATRSLSATPNGESLEIMLPDDTICVLSPAPVPPRREGAQFADGMYIRIEFVGADTPSGNTQLIVYPRQSIVLRCAKPGTDGRPVLVLLQVEKGG